MFHRICTRFLTETRTVSYLLQRLTEDEDVEDTFDLMTRLSIIYDVYYPVRERIESGA